MNTPSRSPGTGPATDLPRPSIGQRLRDIEVRAVSGSHVVFAHSPGLLTERLDVLTREAFATHYMHP